MWAEHVLPPDIRGLIADGDRFVAVGNTSEGQVAWTSTDGASWDQHPVPLRTDLPDESTGFPGDANVGASMGQLVRLDDTLYSFGHFSFMDFFRPVGWRWTDGGAWEPITSPSPFYEAGIVRDVVAGDGVLIAARLGVALSEFGADSEVWAWNAATSWVQSDLSIIEPERVVVNHLASSDGEFLASGVVVPEQAATDAVWEPRMWRSADGHAWSQIEPPSEGSGVCALEADAAGGFVAMGSSSEETVVWRWSDGNWSAVPLVGSPAHPDRSTNPFFISRCALVPLSDRTVAILSGEDGTRAWWSTDGASWVGGETLAVDGATHIAGFGSTLVLARVEHELTDGLLRTIVMSGSIR